MKKIMFNDMYGLTFAVLSGKKTQIRRTVKCPRTYKGIEVSGFRISRNIKGDWISYLVDEDEREIDGSSLKPAYTIGEEVAVAQSYEMIISNMDSIKDIELLQKQLTCTAEESWHNKMFVRADLMPHRIRITNIRVERLQDISDEDCLNEGITPIYEASTDKKVIMWYALNNIDRESRYENPREAYAALIDKISGKGTWDSNPYVFVYDFELA